MTKYDIPQDEVDNFVSVYWQMLRELEEHTDPKKDVLNKILVEGAYKILNRSNIFGKQMQPRWLHVK